jgi:hypothetical protein
MARTACELASTTHTVRYNLPNIILKSVHFPLNFPSLFSPLLSPAAHSLPRQVSRGVLSCFIHTLSPLPEQSSRSRTRARTAFHHARLSGLFSTHFTANRLYVCKYYCFPKSWTHLYGSTEAISLTNISVTLVIPCNSTVLHLHNIGVDYVSPLPSDCGDSFAAAIETGLVREWREEEHSKRWREEEHSKRWRERESAEALVGLSSGPVVHQKSKEMKTEKERYHGYCNSDSDSEKERHCAAETLIGLQDTTEQKCLLRKYRKWFPELQSRTPSPRQLEELRKLPSASSNDEVLVSYMIKIGVYPRLSASPIKKLESPASPVSTVYESDISPTGTWPQSPLSIYTSSRSPPVVSHFNIALSPLKEIPPPLRQIQYRSYKQPITLYHYNTRLLAIRDFRNRLTKANHGYVYSLISQDPLRDLDIADGDKTPDACIEAVYMPNLFRHGAPKGRGQGCAIGLRFQSEQGKMQVEWLCYWKAGRELVEQCRNEKGEVVFDKVAEVEKESKRGRKREGEHWDWWRSLEGGKIKDVRLKLVLGEKETGAVSD